MKKTIVAVFLLMNIIIYAGCFSPCFCQEQYQIVQSESFKGNIVYLDFVSSKTTVKYLQPDGNNDEITLQVSSHTKINKGDLRIALTDLNKGDEVSVEYYDDPGSFDAPKVSQINVKPLF
jgi:hypothetical protein